MVRLGAAGCGVTGQGNQWFNITNHNLASLAGCGLAWQCRVWLGLAMQGRLRHEIQINHRVG